MEVDALRSLRESGGLTRCVSEQPNSLGPFAVAAADYSSMGMVVFAEKSGGIYQVDMTCPCLRSVANIPNLADAGSLSPTTTITFTAEERRKAQIPDGAQSFLFAYPLAGCSDSSDMHNLDLRRAEIAFLALGGFVYLDGASQVCGVNSLCQGQGLDFNGPTNFTWPNARQKLYRDGRIQEVTAMPLVKLGIKGFCWLAPNEEIDGVKGDAWRHGAFLYTYADHGKDCFFHIDPNTDRGPQAKAAARMPVMPFSVACGRARADVLTNAAAEASGSDFNCKICMDKSIEVVLIPCGHLCLCAACADSMRDKTCPICRTAVRQQVNVFL
jgi:hypothetical protein